MSVRTDRTAEDDDVAIKLLMAMKRWNVLLKLSHALVEQGIDIDVAGEDLVLSEEE